MQIFMRREYRQLTTACQVILLELSEASKLSCIVAHKLSGL